MRRWLQGSLGIALIAGGLAGVVSITPSPGRALASFPSESHAAMHRMMDAVHGPGTSGRMHRVRGAEQMMDGCAAMMESMPGMIETMGVGMGSGR